MERVKTFIKGPLGWRLGLVMLGLIMIGVGFAIARPHQITGAFVFFGGLMIAMPAAISAVGLRKPS